MTTVPENVGRSKRTGGQKHLLTEGLDGKYWKIQSNSDKQHESGDGVELEEKPDIRAIMECPDKDPKTAVEVKTDEKQEGVNARELNSHSVEQQSTEQAENLQLNAEMSVESNKENEERFDKCLKDIIANCSTYFKEHTFLTLIDQLDD